MSEGQTWSSEDTRVFSYKVFFGSARRCHFVSVVSYSTDRLPSSEAERIVFAAEGLLLAHRFRFNCGIRVQSNGGNVGFIERSGFPDLLRAEGLSRSRPHHASLDEGRQSMRRSGDWQSRYRSRRAAEPVERETLGL